MSEWIPVTERMPEKGQSVLVWWALCEMVIMVEWDGAWSGIDDEGWKFYHDEDITHWMPLPEPPKVTE